MFERPAPGDPGSGNGDERPAGHINPMARLVGLTSGAAPSEDTLVTGPATVPAPAPTAPSTSTPPVGRPTVGRLAHVAASSLWPDDAAFAAWIAANLEAVGEPVSLQLKDGSMPRPDSPVVLAEDTAGNPVVIVCELGHASDEGFGRFVRNVAASSAKHALWVCGDPGNEYGASISWLNRAVDGRFSMVKVSAVTIGASAAAPMFELAVRTPRADDEGVTSDVPPADDDPGTTRRINDWLGSVGAQDTES